MEKKNLWTPKKRAGNMQKHSWKIKWLRRIRNKSEGTAKVLPRAKVTWRLEENDSLLLAGPQTPPKNILIANLLSHTGISQWLNKKQTLKRVCISDTSDLQMFLDHTRPFLFVFDLCTWEPMRILCGADRGSSSWNLFQPIVSQPGKFCRAEI